MKFSALLLIVSFPFLAAAQPKKQTKPTPLSGTDWLLWYQGKRKNDSVLLTNKGWQVTYQKKSNTVHVKQPALPAFFKKMETELGNTKARRIQMIRRLTGGGRIDPSDLPVIEFSMAGVDAVEKEYKGILTATRIDLPEEEPVALNSRKPDKTRGPSVSYENEEASWQTLYASIQSDVAALPNVAMVKLPEPPASDLSRCMECDTAAKANLERRKEDYINSLVKDEREVLQKCMALSRMLTLMNDADPGGATAEMTEAQRQIAINYIVQMTMRVERKLARLIAASRTDLMKMATLIPLSLQLSRWCQLMGLEESLQTQFTEMIKAADVEAFLKKSMDELNYDVALNLVWMLKTERQFQLLGEQGFMQGAVFGQVLDFNRFALTVTADAKYADDGISTIGQVKSEVHAYKAIPTKDCKFLFVQSRSGKATGVGQPFVNFDLLRAEHHDPDNPFKYVGTKKFVMIDPLLKIGFCGEEDTVKLFPIMPSLDASSEQWESPGGGGKLALITGLFSDAFENNENTVEEDESMLEKMQSIQTFTTQLGTAEEVAGQPVALNRGYGIVAQIKEQFAVNALTLVPLTAASKSSVLFDHLHNGKLFTKTDGIVYANMWLKMEHVK